MCKQGNATDQVLTNLNLENERSSRCIRILLNTAHLIILFLFITPYWCFGFKTPLVIIKLKKVFNLLLLEIDTTVSTTGMAMFRTNSGVLLQQLAGNYASNNVPNSYATELKVGYAARLFYGDAFIANKKSG
jgi:hypothetical protein